MKKTILKYFLYLQIILLQYGCNKDWLELKSDKTLSVPETLKDLQAILDNTIVLNRQYANVGNAGTDNIFIDDQDGGAFNDYDINQYLWKKEIPWYNENTFLWNFPFTVIESSNIVLEGLQKFDQNNATYKNLKGQALFYRALAYYSTAQVFCKQYEADNAKIDMGLPLREQSDVNQITKRSNLQEVYDLILSDLSQSINLLPVSGPYNTRPTSIAAQAMLSRVFLNMQDYKNAKLYADSVLNQHSELLDFNNTNQVSHSFAFKFSPNAKGNPEVLFYAYKSLSIFETAFLGQTVQASKELYNLYEDSDLRKEFFFGKSNTKLNFISSYTGGRSDFSGIATNEIYLIRSECNARLNNLQEAKSDLNKLLAYRFKKGLAPTINESNQLSLIRKILQERRKELPHTGNTRWEDLRRLNLDPNFAVTLTRIFKGEQYSLEPNSPRYVLPIPNNELRLSSIEQNQR